MITAVTTLDTNSLFLIMNPVVVVVVVVEMWWARRVSLEIQRLLRKLYCLSGGKPQFRHTYIMGAEDLLSCGSCLCAAGEPVFSVVFT